MENIPLYNFDIAETKQYQKQQAKIDSKLLLKIKNIVYPVLRKNPYFGTNIKKLKGDLEGYYRYRIGSYRLFYIIKDNKVLVVITSLKSRQNSY
jgi:mRNA interferase RelE/StbE